MADELAIVGKSLTKPDAFAKVSGQTRFADDLALPRMLFGRILRSPHPHARIVRVDTSRARALPAKPSRRSSMTTMASSFRR